MDVVHGCRSLRANQKIAPGETIPFHVLLRSDAREEKAILEQHLDDIQRMTKSDAFSILDTSSTTDSDIVHVISPSISVSIPPGALKLTDTKNEQARLMRKLKKLEVVLEKVSKELVGPAIDRMPADILEMKR